MTDRPQTLITPCIQISKLDLVFGNRPEQAFQLLDHGKGRAEVQKETGQVVGVQGVSLDVFPGEILVLMGLSGSGKSSLLRCLNGLNGREHGKTRGSVLFQPSERDRAKLAPDYASGMPVDIQRCSNSRLRELRRHHISMVFQQFGLMPWETVLDNVAFPLKLQGIAKKERNQIAEEKLVLVGLKDWLHRYPKELSGGMQQRVGLARAFATDAEVLLMDEPFSALDPLHRQFLQEELLNLQSKLNKTIVFVTHDFNEALRLADRLAIMEAGKILQLAAPDEIVAAPNCEGVRKFIPAPLSGRGFSSQAAGLS